MAHRRGQSAAEAARQEDRLSNRLGGGSAARRASEGHRDADRVARSHPGERQGMNINFNIPSWIAEGLGPVTFGIFGFTASRFFDSRLKASEQAKTLSDNVLNLTSAVTNASQEINTIREEIHNVTGDLKKEIHEQIGGLREELKEARMEYRDRLALIDNRMNVISVQTLENKKNIQECSSARDRDIDLEL